MRRNPLLHVGKVVAASSVALLAACVQDAAPTMPEHQVGEVISVQSYSGSNAIRMAAALPLSGASLAHQPLDDLRRVAVEGWGEGENANRDAPLEWRSPPFSGITLSNMTVFALSTTTRGASISHAIDVDNQGYMYPTINDTNIILPSTTLHTSAQIGGPPCFPGGSIKVRTTHQASWFGDNIHYLSGQNALCPG